jgi:hypothetical protein
VFLADGEADSEIERQGNKHEMSQSFCQNKNFYWKLKEGF